MIVDDPVVSAEYEAIAAALRPHVVDGFLAELTYAQIVGIAATAVVSLAEGWRDKARAAEADCVRVATEASDAVDAAVRAANELVATTTDAFASRIAELEGVAHWWELESARVGTRMAALEALRVQAEARWGHERGPSLLREALDAARLPDGG